MIGCRYDTVSYNVLKSICSSTLFIQASICKPTGAYIFRVRHFYGKQVCPSIHPQYLEISAARPYIRNRLGSSLHRNKLYLAIRQHIVHVADKVLGQLRQPPQLRLNLQNT